MAELYAKMDHESLKRVGAKIDSIKTSVDAYARSSHSTAGAVLPLPRHARQHPDLPDRPTARAHRARAQRCRPITPADMAGRRP